MNETADGVVLATHNAVLADGRWLSDLTLDVLLTEDLAEWEHRRAPDVITEALAAGAAVIYLDLKAVTPEGLKFIAGTWPAEVADGQIVFASARADVVAWVIENIPEASTSFLYYDRQLDLRSLAEFTSPTFVHPCFDHLRDPMRYVDDQFVRRATSLGFRLVSWNEVDVDRIARLAELGFDFVCTDEPALAAGSIWRE